MLVKFGALDDGEILETGGVRVDATVELATSEDVSGATGGGGEFRSSVRD